jgi:hypothetical protein
MLLIIYGIYEELFLAKKGLRTFKKFLVPFSLKTKGNNRSSPKNGPIKKNLLTKH